MADLSNAAFWAAVLMSAAATLAYWAQTAGLRVVVRRLATDAGRGPAVASLEASHSRENSPTGNMASALSWATTIALLAWVATRWAAVHHAPWSNMHEFTVAFAAAIAAFYVVFERGTVGGSNRPAARALGALVHPLILSMLIAAAIFFPSEIRPLVPPLQNADLLAIHVAAMILAYGAFAVSFAAAALYIAQGGKLNRFERLPKARLLDDLAYRSVTVGFPLLAAGIALGAYWADHAWGRYWDWDPKETSALATLLIYGIYLHTRSLRGWAGMRSAWVLIGGFGAVIFTYFVVNLWISGLHSYAGV